MPRLRPMNTFYGSADEVQAQIERESDKRVKLKLHAIEMLMRGVSQKETAETIGVSTATIRSWTLQWNTGGLRDLEPRHIGVNKIEADMYRYYKDRGYKTIRLSRNFDMIVTERGGPLDWIQAESPEVEVVKVVRKPKLPKLPFPDGPITMEALNEMADRILR